MLNDLGINLKTHVLKTYEDNIIPQFSSVEIVATRQLESSINKPIKYRMKNKFIRCDDSKELSNILNTDTDLSVLVLGRFGRYNITLTIGSFIYITSIIRNPGDIPILAYIISLIHTDSLLKLDNINDYFKSGKLSSEYLDELISMQKFEKNGINCNYLDIR